MMAYINIISRHIFQPHWADLTQTLLEGDERHVANVKLVRNRRQPLCALLQLEQQKHTLAGVLRVGMEVQVGHVGRDVLDGRRILRPQAANIANSCSASTAQPWKLSACRRLREVSTQLAGGVALRMRSQGKSCQVHSHVYMSGSPGSITADDCRRRVRSVDMLFGARGSM